MWRDDGRVRARTADIDQATAQTRRIRGDLLPPSRRRGDNVRLTVARVARLAAAFALAVAGALEASAELAEAPISGRADCGPPA